MPSEKDKEAEEEKRQKPDLCKPKKEKLWRKQYVYWHIWRETVHSGTPFLVLPIGQATENSHFPAYPAGGI